MYQSQQFNKSIIQYVPENIQIELFREKLLRQLALVSLSRIKISCQGDDDDDGDADNGGGGAWYPDDTPIPPAQDK